MDGGLCSSTFKGVRSAGSASEARRSHAQLIMKNTMETGIVCGTTPIESFRPSHATT